LRYTQSWTLSVINSYRQRAAPRRRQVLSTTTDAVACLYRTLQRSVEWRNFWTSDIWTKFQGEVLLLLEISQFP